MTVRAMEIQAMPPAALAAACRLDTERYLLGEQPPGYACRELFRRAVCQRDEAAWQALFAQYRPLVIIWIRRHPMSASLTLADDDWVALTFERFFGAVGSEDFATFAAPAQLLHYLKRCAHSAVIDEARARPASVESLDESLPDRRSHIEAATVDRMAARQLWQRVLARAHGEAEHIVARLCFASGLKPREIQARHPALFPTVTDVYRTLRNLRERLARDPEIRCFLTE